MVAYFIGIFPVVRIDYRKVYLKEGKSAYRLWIWLFATLCERESLSWRFAGHSQIENKHKITKEYVHLKNWSIEKENYIYIFHKFDETKRKINNCETADN